MNTRIGKTFWFDLPARDLVDARSFYEALFNWQFLKLDSGSPQDYWAIQSGDDLIGGLRQTTEKIGSSQGPILYFTVDDLNGYKKRIKDLGGELVGDAVVIGNNGGVYQWFRDREKNLLALWVPQMEK